MYIVGQYCLFMKDRCPVGFEEGSIYWDDAAPFMGGTVQSFSGKVLLTVTVCMYAVLYLLSIQIQYSVFVFCSK